MKSKKSVLIPVSVHWIKYEIIEGLKNNRINLSSDSYRGIAEIIGIPKKDKGAAQKIKHHLDALVSMGTLDKINGKYAVDYKKFPFRPPKRWHPTT